MKQVKDFIVKDITSVNENSTVRRAIKTMRLHRLSVVPVVNKLGEFIGCIREEDILEAAVPDYMKKYIIPHSWPILIRFSVICKEFLTKRQVSLLMQIIRL